MHVGKRVEPFLSSNIPVPDAPIQQILSVNFFDFIAKYLDDRDLKSTRCVNQYWLNASITWIKDLNEALGAEAIEDNSNQITAALRQLYWFEAIKTGNLDTLQTIYKDDPTFIKIRDHQGYNSAHQAVLADQLPVIQFLGTAPELFNEYNHSDGYTPFQMAINHRRYQIVEYICGQNKACLDSICKPGWNPLQLATLAGNHAIFELIYKNKPGLIVAKHQPANNNFLHLAVQGRSYAVTESIVKKCSKFISSPNGAGDYPIHWAIKSGLFEAVKLLDKKCPSRIKEPGSEGTSLHLACYDGNIELFQYVFKKCHYMKTLTCKEGFLPHHIAIIKGHLNIIRIFINERNKDLILSKGPNDLNVLHLVNSLDPAKYLYHLAPNLLIEVDDQGINPVLSAGQKGELEILKFFISQKNLIKSKTYQGQNILHLAARGVDIDDQEYKEKQALMIEYLIDEYPELLIEIDNQDRYPDQYALEYMDITSSARMKAARIKYLLQSKSEPLKQLDISDALSLTKHPFSFIAAPTNAITIERKVDSANEPQTPKGAEEWFEIVANSDLETIRFLCSDPSLLDLKDIYGNNCAHRAVLGSSLQVVDFLYDNSYIFTQYNQLGYTPFQLAITQGRIEVVKLLCQKSKVKFMDALCKKLNYNPLQLAAVHGQYEVFEYLYKLVPEQIDAQVNEGNFLHVAVRGKNYSIIEFIVRQYPQFISRKNAKSYYPLHLAIETGQVKAVELLDKKCPSLMKESSPETSALHLACIGGRLEIVKHICRNKKNAGMKKIQNKGGCLPFHLAVIYGHLEIIDYFCKEDKSILNEKTSKGFNVLHLANDLQTAKHLYGLNNQLLTHLTKNGYNPVHLAAQKGALDLVEFYLSENKSLYNAKTDDLNNILHLAAFGNVNKDNSPGAKEKQTLMVKYLTDTFPELTLEHNKHGENPYTIARNHMEINVAAYIAQAGTSYHEEMEAKKLESPQLVATPSISNTTPLLQKSKKRTEKPKIEAMPPFKSPEKIEKKIIIEQSVPLNSNSKDLPQPEIHPIVLKRPSVHEKEKTSLVPLVSSSISTQEPIPTTETKEPKKPHVIKVVAKKIHRSWQSTVGLSKEDKEKIREEKAKRRLEKRLFDLAPSISASQSECSQSMRSETSEVEKSIAEGGFKSLVNALLGDGPIHLDKKIIYDTLENLESMGIIKITSLNNNKVRATLIGECHLPKRPSLTIHMHNHDKPWDQQYNVKWNFLNFIEACGIDTAEIRKAMAQTVPRPTMNNTNDEAQDAGEG